jgi:hypothetical protein
MLSFTSGIAVNVMGLEQQPVLSWLSGKQES